MKSVCMGVWQWWRERRAAREGAADGRVNLPLGAAPWEPPRVHALGESAQRRGELIGQRWLARDRRPAARHRSAHEREAPRRRRVEESEAALVDRQARANDTARQSSLERDERRQAGRGGLDREWSLSPWTFWAVSFGIAVGDYPLNRLIFASLDRGWSWSGWLVSGGVQVLVLAAGKILGILVHRVSKSNRDHYAVAVASCVALVAIATCAGLALLRVEYAEARFRAVQAIVVQAGGAASLAAPAGKPPSHAVSVLTFTSIYLCSLVVGVALSFLTHDAARDHQVRGMRLAGWQVGRARRKLARAEGRCRAKGTRRHREFERACAEDHEWAHRYSAIVSVYWVHNLRTRVEPVTPELSRLATDTASFAVPLWRTASYRFDLHVPPALVPLARVVAA